MENNYLTEAFKAFDLLNEEMFPVTSDGEEKLKKFIDGDKIGDVTTIIDIDAEDYEDLKPSYIGNVILNCPVCQSKIYKEPKDIIIDEEKELVNVDEECPYCHTNGGFEIIGEVAEYKPEPQKEEEVPESEETEVKVDNEVVEESCKKEPLTEDPDLGKDLEKYQDWVDYDMERYGKISNITKRELDKAGLEIVKDDHGDYEVIAKDKRDLNEAKGIRALPVATYLTKHMKEIDQFSPSAARDSVLKILERGKKEADEEYRDQFDKEISNLKNVSTRAVWSAIGTLLTGIKAGLKESFDEVEVKTGDENIKVTSEGEKTKVEVEPREEERVEATKEVIEPVSDEMKVEIEDNSKEEEDEVVDAFDDETFDDLEERYLKRIYENVKAYKTTSCTVTPKGKIVLEGVITFTSGNKKKTSFIFESKFKTKSGKMKYLGENKNLASNKRAFTITGNIKNKTLIVESFTYNYIAKDAKNNSSRRVYGTIRK